MKEIKLTKGKISVVDDEDFDSLSNYSWHVLEFSDNHVYARTQLSMVGPDGYRWKREALMHRIITDAAPSEVVDHINGDTLDNRRSNLRKCSQSENSKNARKHSPASSRYKGVVKNKTLNGQTWTTQIQCDGKRIHIGTFNSEEDAAAAYDTKAIELFGEYAHTNFPSCANG